MIDIQKLHVSVTWTDKQILNWISLNFEKWKNYCLLGKNGSGKSTLSSVLAWSPKYSIDSGSITIDKQDLLTMSPEERSAAWVFLTFQNVPEIPWIKLSEYLRTIYNIHLKRNNPETRELSPFLFKRFIKKILQDLEIDEKFLDRDLNVWFSGWEKRKLEILQIKLINPSYIILDEIDSGLDLDAFRQVAQMLQGLNNWENSLIIITHYFKILEYIDVDEVHIMRDGNIAESWGKELVEGVIVNGFGK